MGQNLKLDPKTGDYVVVNGRPVEDDSLDTPSYIRLKANRTKWLYAPDDQWGSDFYLFSKRQLPGTPKALIAVGQRALKPLVDGGRAQSTQTVLAGAVRGTVDLTSTVVSAAGKVTTLTFNPVGN